MSGTFRCYIDESGCEGFAFDRGSSEWFILTGLFVRKEDDLSVTSIVDKVRAFLQKAPKKHIHWKDLKHEQKVYYIGEIAKTSIKVVSVCINKREITNVENFQQKNRLYFYATRYLLERLSWIARDDYQPNSDTGNGSIDFTFSNRSNISYKELNNYMNLLERMSEVEFDIRIEWTHIGLMQALPPGKIRGLQLADACAGAFFNALEKNRFGYVEPRYIETLRSVVYCHGGRYMGYGFKIVPKKAAKALMEDRSKEWVQKFIKR